MEIVNIKIDKLKPYDKNAKKHDKTQIDNVAESIKQFDMVQPLVVDKNDVVIIGHCRLLACKQLGMKEVPCVRADTLTDEQVAKLRLLDNKLNESDWDLDLLSEELADLDLDDFELDWGIDELEPDKEVQEDDFDVESAIPEEPKAKYGDVYLLGEHRLMCGDSTKEEDVAKLMDGEKADILMTSPPYAMNDGATLRNHYVAGKPKLKSLYVTEETTDWLELITKMFENAQKHTSSQFVNIQMLATNKKDLILFLNNNLDYLVDIMVWNKHTCPPQMHNRVLNNAFEFIFVFDNENDSRSIRFASWKGKYSNYIETNKEINKYADIHKAVYSVEIVDRILKINDTAKSVLDLFGGTGTTLIACEQLGRKCYMMELEPKYVDVIIARWEQYTGKKAVKVN